MDLKEQNLVLRIIQYSINKDSLTMRELIRDLKLDEFNQRYVQLFLLGTHNGMNSNHILGEVVRDVFQGTAIVNHLDYRYKLLPSAVFQYVDYLEIKEARKNARQAFILSVIAILLALWQVLS